VNWIFLAVGAQLLLAVVAVIDKYIVSDDRVSIRPFVYAFYTCLIAGAWIIVYVVGLLPIPAIGGLSIPSFSNIEHPTLVVVAFSFLAAYSFFFALVSMFTALRQADASDVVPVIGATSAIVTFALGHYFLESMAFVGNMFAGMALLVVGTFLVSKFHFTIRTATMAIHSGIFFAIHYVVIKGLFEITSFDNAFFWSRVAFMVFAVSLLLVPSYWCKIREETAGTSKKTGGLILFNKILAGVSTILILKATELGDVAIVQALGGVQYVFILIIGIVITFTRCFGGKCEIYPQESILQKAIFVAIITLGFLVLFV